MARTKADGQHHQRFRFGGSRKLGAARKRDREMIFDAPWDFELAGIILGCSIFSPAILDFARAQAREILMAAWWMARGPVVCPRREEVRRIHRVKFLVNLFFVARVATMSPRAASLILLAGGMFLSGWGLARWTAPPVPVTSSADSSLDQALSQPGPPGPSKSKPAPPPASRSAPDAELAESRFPGVFDPQVLAALQNPDLIAAVRDIMARSQEDHCADTRLIQLIESLPESRLAELPALLAANSDNDYVLRFVLPPWAERQPEAALAWAGSQASTNATLLTSVLTGWTRRDPTAALEWTLAQPLSTNTRALQTSLIETLAEADPARALAVLNDTGWINTNSQAVLKLLKNWRSQDPAAAMTGLRSMMAGFGMASKAGQSPEDPFNQVFKNQFNGLLGALLNRAGSRSAADVTALLRQLTPEETQTGAASIARDFLTIHPEAVQALLGNPNPGSPDKALLLALAESDAGSILEKLSDFHDPAFRQALLAVTAYESYMSSKLGSQIANSKVAQSALMQTLSETGADQRGALIGNFAQATVKAAPDFATKLWSQLEPARQQLEGETFLLKLARQAPDSALEI